MRSNKILETMQQREAVEELLEILDLIKTWGVDSVHFDANAPSGRSASLSADPLGLFRGIPPIHPPAEANLCIKIRDLDDIRLALHCSWEDAIAYE